MSVNPRVVHKRRATITALPLYYSGHLLKKHTEDKDFKSYYGELRGATLFLYTDDTQDTYTEKLDLEQLKSMELNSPYQRKTPTIFTLTLLTEEVQLKMDNPDTGEEWRGYILTVVKKQIPSKLQLLPGQMLLLQEALDQERRRNPPVLRPPLPPRPAFLRPASPCPSPVPAKDKPDNSILDMPACFLNVSREEAEKMLCANPEYGSIILRPSTMANNYALTLRQQTSRGHVMKNYRVSSSNSGFVIELETAVTVSTLNDVLKYFLEKTEYRLHPYMASQPYETRIEPSPAPKNISITSPALKTVPKAQVAPMLRSQTKEESLPPPTKPAEGEYVVPDDHRPDEHKLKLDQLDSELRQVLRLRRESIQTASGEDEMYENQLTEKALSCTAQWTKSAAECDS
ncbi:signal-transducing adaptor protein 1 isoform X2 [Seriola dumerili]|uniref:signal-transducing adaptor protein 1 isoform X2 n=1 Tax=Seriola dumerili TaxID=41447 RepID=UPI000BBEDF8E|nr:signal-transducing adaptor protein 1 isoform X2 [Seriola dumerili]